MDDLGGKPTIFGNTQLQVSQLSEKMVVVVGSPLSMSMYTFVFSPIRFFLGGVTFFSRFQGGVDFFDLKGIVT